MSTQAAVRLISECYIKPQLVSDEAKQPIHLSPLDLRLLLINYIQKGLLFAKPKGQEFSITDFLQKLKTSLLTTLTHFYPLAGGLATRKQEEDPPSCVIYLDPNVGPGAKFVHADLDLMVSDILSPNDVPSIVRSFFDQSKVVNHDGHDVPLLSIQVTELVDGVFISCSINHSVCDGTSFWHFFNTWSEVFMKSRGVSDDHSIPRPPVHERWIGDGFDPIVKLPFTHPDELVYRRELSPQLLRERIFHFSSNTLSKLKAKTNSQYSNIASSPKISTLQSLSALVWRCITRAQNPPPDQETTYVLAVNNRSRIDPPLSNDYVGNYIHSVSVTVKAKDLLEHDLGWAARMLNEGVVNHDHKTLRKFIEGWLRSPLIVHEGMYHRPFWVLMGSSPRFDVYGNEFGLGKALAVRSGWTNKFSGKVTLYPGSEGGGSMDVEICLRPDTMAAFESDDEFVAALSSR